MKKKTNLYIFIISVFFVTFLIIIFFSHKNEISTQSKRTKQKDSVIKNLKNQNYQDTTYTDTVVEDTIQKIEKDTTESETNNNMQKTIIVEIEKNKNNSEIIKNTSQIINYRNQDFYSYVVDLTKSNLSFNSKTKSGEWIKTINRLKNYLSLQNKTLIFATNGGMFNQNFNPVGLYIENGKELFHINLGDGKGNFFLKPNGIFYINKWGGAGIIESSVYPKIKGKLKYATQSGPLLLLNDQINKNFGKNSQNKYIRNAVGIINKDSVVFVISKNPVNFYDLAMFFKEEFNCKNALYLDGFISEMYLPELGLTKTKNEFSILINVTTKSK